VIATLQIKDVFALPIAHMPETYLEKVRALWMARGGASLADFATALTTLALLLAFPRALPKLTARVPAPLLAIGICSLGATALPQFGREFAVPTIGSRFQSMGGGKLVSGIPQIPPLPTLPWGAGGLTLGSLNHLASAAFAIAMLGAIESLLSATIA